MTNEEFEKGEHRRALSPVELESWHRFNLREARRALRERLYGGDWFDDSPQGAEDDDDTIAW